MVPPSAGTPHRRAFHRRGLVGCRALRERLIATREPLSPAVSGRLRAARRTALAALKEAPAAGERDLPRRAVGRRLAAFGGAAVAVSAAGLALHGLAPTEGVPDEASPPALVAIDARDWPLLAEDEEVDFYDDIEFWVWLEESEAGGRDPRG